MGGGASKQEETKPSGQQEPAEARLKKELASERAENERLRRELDKAKAAPVIIAPPPSAKHDANNPVFQVIVTADQATAIAKVSGVTFKYGQGSGVPLMPGRENVLVVSCPAGAVSDVIKLASSPFEVPRPPKPVPDAPPKISTEATPDAEAEPEPEKPKIEVPKGTVAAKTDINLKEWDGKIVLTFTWLHEPSPYSEWSDPSGQNWWNTTNVRRAPDHTPTTVDLQYRRGFNGEWVTVPCTINETGASCKVALPVDEVSPMAFRGFQSRWIVDGEKYLSPLQLAPTLQSKLMTYPMVRSAVKALPEDKQTLENIPNEDLRNAIMKVENIIPMNTWDYSYGLTLVPGAWIDQEHVLTVPEKVEWIAKQKTQDPAIVSEIRKAILKSPIMAANAALGLVGIKLNVIVDNLDFFLPKYADPDFLALEALEASMVKWENLRREMQTDVNGLYPAYQQGIRVSFPPARVLRNAIKARRPEADIVSMPLQVSWIVDKADDTVVQHSIQFVYWTDDYSKHSVANCVAAVGEDTFGSPLNRETKQVWKHYVADLSLPKGQYKYHWIYDGANFFNNGSPYGDQFAPATAYLQFSIDANVAFGIGVPM
jgi:hypothetical protein